MSEKFDEAQYRISVKEEGADSEPVLTSYRFTAAEINTMMSEDASSRTSSETLNYGPKGGLPLSTSRRPSPALPAVISQAEAEELVDAFMELVRSSSKVQAVLMRRLDEDMDNREEQLKKRSLLPFYTSKRDGGSR